MSVLLRNLCSETNVTRASLKAICQTRRHTSNKRAKLKRYTASLNLPKTSFKDSLKNGAASAREREIQKECSAAALYNWQLQQDRKDFILHDGPPYANGNPHVGHALNKILKDVVNRYKLLQGYKIHYVPGWDCHGMPIEQKALASIKGNYKSLDPILLREKARQFATQSLKKQKSSFKRWGVLADWDKQTYKTYDKEYIANELDVFYKMYAQGLVYEDYMPVHWSSSSGSALAEAELEYNDNHISSSVHVKLRIKELPEDLSTKLASESSDLSLIIWTTTPWTLPANMAVCFSENMEYSFVKQEETNDILLLSTECLVELSKLCNLNVQIVHSCRGYELLGMKYVHPVFKEKVLNLLPAQHVKPGVGTGLVHTAPAHGPEDFQVAIKHGLSLECCVDESGKYTSEVGEGLAGLDVLSEGNNAVLDIIYDSILHKEDFKHSYPYDWRTKSPVIYRASKQWFVNTQKIKDKALESLSNVEVYPKSTEHGMKSQIESRTYWCISRQRVWGVPIPIFYESSSGKALITEHSVNHVKNLILQHGPDCWWKLPLSELLPIDVIEKSGFDTSSEYIRGNDVLDIWFDSGTSWATVLKEHDGECDVYMEGLDQFGGWFQSSLLTSIAATNKPPYKSLVVHGFTVDDEGKKMSKSLGNVVDPDVVVNGGKNKESHPSYGADLLRWWSMQAGLNSRVFIGSGTLKTCNEEMFKIRKILRYLVGNLHDFGLEDIVPSEKLPVQDRYMLYLLHQFSEQVTEAYDTYSFIRVTQLIEKFINIHVSPFYCHITKDRMYCEHSDSFGRRACQTVQYHILSCLSKCMAPIAPHMAEEIHKQPPFRGIPDSIFKTDWFNPDESWNEPEVRHTMDAVLEMRDTFKRALQNCDPVDFDVVLAAKWNLFQDIKKLQPDDLTSKNSGLTEVLGCSTCSVVSTTPKVIPDEATVIEGKFVHTKSDGFQKERKYLVIILPTEDFICERCRRYTSDKYGKPCDRCTDVLATGWEE